METTGYPQTNDCNTYEWYTPTTWFYQSHCNSKIQLTTEEFDILRAAAFQDEDLKAILDKFVPYIEVDVSLE